MTEQLRDRARRTLPVLFSVTLAVQSSAQTPSPAKADAAKPAASTAGVAAQADPDVELAKKAAVSWLELVDSGKLEASWDEAATSFQKAQTKADWAKGLGGARPTMGKLVSRTFLNHEIRANLPNLPPGKYITVRFTSVFEKNKNGGESVTLIKDGTRGFRMMSYFLK